MSTHLEYATDEDLAAAFGVKVKTIRAMRVKYQWPHIRIGNSIRYTLAQVEQIEVMQTAGKARADRISAALAAAKATKARR